MLRKSKQSLRAAEKNNEKVEANYTGFSAELFGAQSIEMLCFARRTKIQIVDNFFSELGKKPPTSS